MKNDEFTSSFSYWITAGQRCVYVQLGKGEPIALIIGRQSLNRTKQSDWGRQRNMWFPQQLPYSAARTWLFLLENKQTNKKIHSCHSSSPFVYNHVVHKWNETVVFIGLCRNIVKLSLSVVGTPELVLWFQTGCSIACPVFLSSPDSRALWTYRVSVDLSFPPRGWISSWAFQQRGWGLWGNPALSWQTWPPAMTHAQ